MAEKFSFAKLDNENYFVWKYRMELLLTKENLWSVINEEKPDPETAAWTKKDGEARAYIGLLVCDNQLNYVRKATSARNAWDNLKNYHEKSTLSNKVTLMRAICNLKLEENGNVVSHVNAMTELFEKLGALGDRISDDWVVAMLLSSLPKSYDTLITALETRPEGDLTLSLVQSKLLEEYRKRSIRTEEKTTESVLKTTHTAVKPKVSQSLECFFCKRKGHMKRDCKKFKDWAQKKDQANTVVNTEDFAFISSTMSAGRWIIDSGATCHIAAEKHLFNEIDTSVRGRVTVGNGMEVEAEGRGSCHIKLVNTEGASSTAKISDVYYMPKMNGNLLSAHQLTVKGFSLLFQKEACDILQNGDKIGSAKMESGLYYLRQPNTVQVAVEKRHNEHCIHSLHRKFGHRDPDAIRKMCAEGLMDDIKLIECGIKQTCEVCFKGKFSRLPFPRKSVSSSAEPLELIHTDVCGPMRTGSVSGKRYFVTFIDDHSRYCSVYFLQHKSDVLSVLKEFVAAVFTQFGKVPKTIRSDRGGEYTGHEVTNYLKSKGIHMQYTAAYSPQQNGIAERKNRSLMEMARCMLIDADMEHKFWAEAVATANFMQNRIISSAINNTPIFLWKGLKPTLKVFQVFGAAAYVFIHKEKRGKLENKSKLMTFVGYDENTKAYRMLDRNTCKVEISRDVRFVQGPNQLQPEKKQAVQEEQNIEPAGIQIFLKDNRSSQQAEEIEAVMNTSANSDICSEDEVFTDAEDQMNETIRVSSRANKGCPPKRLIEEIHVAQINKEPTSLSDVLSCKDKDNWKIAMSDELKSLKVNKTWQLVDLPADRKAIGCRWVFKRKVDANGDHCFKARLVAQGFAQRYGEDYDQVFAPVIRHTTLRTFLAVAAKRKYVVHHFDAKTAFLNGNLDEVIFMKQPPGFEEEPNKVCLLKKSIYGLKQAARAWNQAVHRVLMSGNFTQSKADPCLYTKVVESHHVYVLVYVDDLVVASDEEKFIEDTAKLLKGSFEIKCLGPIKHYLGLEVSRDSNGNFMVSQTSYIRKVITEIGLQDSKASAYPLDPNYGKTISNGVALLDNKLYQKYIGCLLYISVNTRPDISASVSILARRVSKPTQEDWNELKRTMKYLKGTADLKLKLSSIETKGDTFFGYADADWAENQEERKSNSGYVFIVNGGIISWCCRKQSCVALSSTEAEFISLAEACQEGVWIQRLLSDLNETVQKPFVVFEDNQSCLKMIASEKFSNRSKHIDTKYHFVKDYVANKIVTCKYCPTEEMVADLLTKPLNANKINYLREKCGLIKCE